MKFALSLPIAALLQLCVETDDSEGQPVDKLKEPAGTDEESSRVKTPLVWLVAPAAERPRRQQATGNQPVTRRVSAAEEVSRTHPEEHRLTAIALANQARRTVRDRLDRQLSTLGLRAMAALEVRGRQPVLDFARGAAS